jgi:glycosyltransferase involved in cell wall biosynthesis
MKDYGKVSVIMPAFNHAEFTAKAIRSVIDQTYQNWELMVVDGGSTDNTAEVVASFKDPRIHYLKDPQNYGCAYSRNNGIRHSTGDWIALLDNDDMWAKQKLEKQLVFMDQHGYTFSCTNYIEVDENDKPTGILVTAPKRIGRYRMGQYGYQGCLTVMYSQKKFGTIQINDKIKNGQNDEALYWELYKQGAVCYLLPEVLAYYRVHSDSVSRRSHLGNLRVQCQLYRDLGHNSFVSWIRAFRNAFFYVLVKKPFYRKKIKVNSNGVDY